MPRKKREADPAKDDFEFGSDVDSDRDETLSMDPTIDADDITAELTEAEKIKLEVEAKNEVAFALKKAKMKDFKAAAKKRIQSEAFFREGKDDTGSDLVTVNLDLASYPKWIMLDGKRYHSGRTYRVKCAVAQVLMDQMFRGWEQERARLGERSDWVKQKQKILGMNGMREVHTH